MDFIHIIYHFYTHTLSSLQSQSNDLDFLAWYFYFSSLEVKYQSLPSKNGRLVLKSSIFLVNNSHNQISSSFKDS